MWDCSSPGPSSGLAWLGIALAEAVPNTVGNASLPALAVRFGLPPVLGMLAGATVLVGTLAFCARHRDRIDPAGTAPWAVLAAGLLFSPIAWHTYMLLLAPGVLILIAQRRIMAAVAALAMAAVPVSWHAEWPPEGLAANVSGSLNCAILLGYGLALLSAARGAVGPSGSGTSHSAPAGGNRSATEAGRPCQSELTASTTPRLPTPESS